MTKFEILTSDDGGDNYEYEATIEAPTAAEARKLWAKQGGWKAVDFMTRQIR